jgi:hypothetical protein
MTGELIHLERHRDLKRGKLYRQQSIPCGPAVAVCATSLVELRVARITQLLTELEELTRLPRSIPAATLDEARAGVEKARRIVCPWTAAVADLKGAPQPELDDERIERMYRELNRDA